MIRRDQRSEPLLPDLIYVTGGEFLIGDDWGRQDERPEHRIELPGFWVARAPVTNAEYARFLAAMGRQPPRFWQDELFRRADQPVVAVTWYDAQDYCGWLSAQMGRRCRLPSEAEWEVAARGGREGLSYAWGSDPPDVDGAPLASRPQRAPAAVCSSPPNGYSLCDLGYNVHEWCLDWYDPRYYLHSPRFNPLGPESGARRSSRGGAWRHQTKVSRCAARSSLNPYFQYNDYGFRIFAE